jgi:hypothetical protein
MSNLCDNFPLKAAKEREYILFRNVEHYGTGSSQFWEPDKHSMQWFIQGVIIGHLPIAAYLLKKFVFHSSMFDDQVRNTIVHQKKVRMDTCKSTV